MNVPGFAAEVSLTQTRSRYRHNLLGRVSPNAVQPARAASAASVAENFWWVFPWEKRVPCCYEFEDRIQCEYYYVPLWWACENINPEGPTCMICHPPEVASNF
jgi:hypothetical protein